MAEPKEILSPEDYTNYRSVRQAAVVLIVLGGIFVIIGIGMLTKQKRDPLREPPALGIGMAIFGLAGVVGGIAVLSGDRRWAKLAHVMSVPYSLVFPFGTIAFYIVHSGLSRYLDSKERVRRATHGGDRSDLADRQSR
jgi:hypothetical protein